jgi:hypothetical protein
MMIDGDRLESTCKWVVLDYLKALSQHLPGQTAKNHGKSVRITDHIAK